MPAYRERVYLCPEENGQPGWIMDFPVWWNRKEFFAKYSERQIDTGHPIYVDYGILLTGWEVSAWDERCRDAFAQDPRIAIPEVAEAMQLWKARLKSTSWVIVESYEWESGRE